MNCCLAIDPGLSGGLAVAQFGRMECHAMPATQGDLLELIRSIASAARIEGDALVCVLEEVSGYAGQAQPGSAMFKFGEHYGFIKGVVQTLGVRLVLVRPQIWQKGLSLGTASGCASKSEWKNKLKAEAQRRFPQLKITLKTADALLLLDWILQSPGEPGRREEGSNQRSVGQRSVGQRSVGQRSVGQRSEVRPDCEPQRHEGHEERGAQGLRRPTSDPDGAQGLRRPTKDFMAATCVAATNQNNNNTKQP